ncbi:MAG TPA: phenylalanine--tRNA ligase subunit beta, partial [Acidimicrobiia bacterium]|nr:phenylalanine--tRNA ligase subunit beta [Acidimicrobiia bacterium]
AAQVLEVVRHPTSNKPLTLVDISTGDGMARVVCGAPNVVAGMVVPYAPPGATLPGRGGGRFTLERRKLAGEMSDGMLCSAKELGLGEDHSGILGLAPATELGRDVREVLGLDDVIFDLAITPNRPDAMCIVGVARELAAHFSLDFVLPEPLALADAAVANDITVTVEDQARCPRYLGRVARVTMGASPAWMAQRLLKAGMRPISNVVDVTNYVLLERNQPLHAFDLSRLAGRGIIVRRANEGETMTTLDDVERTLSGEDLLICDAERAPQAIAGIMGGSTSEVSDTTTEILLESAFFERMGIARTSKRLKLRSESSARFERGIDPDAVAVNAERAMELLVAVAGAQVAADAVDVYPAPVERARIHLRTSRVNAVLGTALDTEDVWASLAPLGIELDSGSSDVAGSASDVAGSASGVAGSAGEVVAIAPTFRPDLEREIDLVEEVARRIGFDRIGRTLPDTHGQVGMLTPRQQERRLVADALVGAGLSEAITLSLVSPADLQRAGAPLDRVVRATNPLRAEESVLRTAVLPGLLRAVAGNKAHGLTDVGLFEMGRVFLLPARPRAGDSPLPDEPEHVALAWAGAVRRRPVEDDRPVDVYDALDAVRVVLDALGIDDVTLQPDTVTGYRAGRAARIVVDGRDAGTVGEIAPDVLTALGLDAPVVAAELVLDTLLDAVRRDRTFRAPSRFPASSVDLAFVLADTVAAADVLATLRSALGDQLEDVRLFDVFTSDAFGAGRRSLAFALRFRVPDRTLTDADVAALRQQAIESVIAAHDAELRG